ncbi:molecular chaperone TorD family protein [Denitrobacterium detoxificans]|uniref:Nitrate reductase delta subunit n=1 Tax=Denitrobacterium detoxificans TaxID=79604 RepID=A0A1H8U1J9_9ACTN|nr:molecular chaperone TorD family protein [Denitrobacterium detoxificans]SEO96528.1 Nitrate reductase delta subunit [Denitrobacterium detoxificans]
MASSSMDFQREHPFALRVRSKAVLCSVLSEVFGYPSVECAENLASFDAVDQCRELAHAARLDLEDTLGLAGLSAEWFDSHCVPGEVDTKLSPGRQLRAECTRLFWSYPRLVRLEGRHWAKSDRRGEVVAVRECYRELGLRNQEGVNAPVDVLASELDYAGYVLRAEADAWDGEDSLSALEWHKLYVSFVDAHLRPCAMGVATGTFEHARNAHVRFYAALLMSVVAEA